MDNNITPEIVERFLNNQSDEAESELVADFLKNVPLEVLNRYLPDDEWQNNEQTEHFSENVSKDMWQSVVDQTTVFKNRRIVYLKMIFVAACAVSVFFTGYYFYSLRSDANVDNPKTQMVAALETIGNTTDADLDTVLPDGSKLILKPSASVHYYSPFKSKREIYLSGIAFFDVVHDSKHPFVVHANGIATTDLGTKFWVLNKEAEQTVTVRLVQGSVVVRSTEKSFGMKDVYLTPGQKVIVNKATKTAYVSGFEGEKTEPPHIAIKKKMEKGNTLWTNSGYTFSKSPLEDVFKKLEIRYGVTIRVKANDISGCQFTGKIMYSDSLTILLKTLCDMNNLTYTKTGNVIDIKK